MSAKVIESIKHVSDVLKANTHHTRVIAHPRTTLTHLNENQSNILKSMRNVSLLVSGQLTEESPQTNSLIHLFTQIGVQRNEEVHSNSLATCFSETTNYAGFHFLKQLLEQISFKNNLIPANLKVSRERRLGSLPWTRSLPIEIQERRLDVLVEHPDLVLAIENKIDSSESLNQTADYHTALKLAYGERKPIVCIFLTPKGDLPESTHFAPLSYSELYLVLRHVSQQLASHGQSFLNFYTHQVFDIFVRPRHKSHLQAKNYWKGKPQ